MTDAEVEREVLLLEEEVARAEQALASIKERARTVAIEADAAQDPRQFRQAVAGRGSWAEGPAAFVGFASGFVSGLMVLGVFVHLFSR
jgi:hypothetical protein